MSRVFRRAITATVVVALGLGWALLFGGGTVSNCLGPLGVTAVRCAAHGGRLPTESLSLPLMVMAIASGSLVALGARDTCVGLLAFVAGAPVGILWYLVTRQRVLEGPDYNGAWLAIPLPVDAWLIVCWALAGGLAAVANAWLVGAARDTRGATASTSPEP